MSEPTLINLAQRLDRLERENRLMKWLGSVLIVGVATVAVMLIDQNRTALLPPGGRIIEAEKFVLKDSSGIVRAILGEAKLKFPHSESPPKYGLYFFDPAGYGTELTQAGLYLNSDFAEAGLSASQMFISHYKRSLAEIDKALAKLGPKDSLQTGRLLAESDASFSATLVGGVANLLLAGEQSATKQPLQSAIELSSASGSTSIRLTDENGRGGVLINNNQGFPDLSLVDKDGKTAATFGRLAFQNPRTGDVVHSSPSLVFLDKGGKIIWSAP